MSVSSLLEWFRGGRQDHPSGQQPLVIIGLGNPGARYAGTKHNIGFMCVDALSSRTQIDLSDRRPKVTLGEGHLAERRLVLAKPRTYVNRSGEAVRYLVDRFHVDTKSVLVILDDLDLPMGRIRFRAAGGSGGHNGLNSINQSLGTDSYARLRFGIGRPEGDTIDYVLTPFSPGETRVVNEGLVRAAEAIEAWIQHGIQYAMNHFN